VEISREQQPFKGKIFKIFAQCYMLNKQIKIRNLFKISVSNRGLKLMEAPGLYLFYHGSFIQTSVSLKTGMHVKIVHFH
jgi:hypothetical protein